LEEEKNKFNEAVQDYKNKLAQSNQLGREFREKCISLENDNQALKLHNEHLDSQLTLKDQQLEEAKLKIDELIEQMRSQEAVFRLQLHELGTFVKQLKAKEAEREKEDLKKIKTTTKN